MIDALTITVDVDESGRSGMAVFVAVDHRGMKLLHGWVRPDTMDAATTIILDGLRGKVRCALQVAIDQARGKVIE